MSKNQTEIPFSEIVERAGELARERPDTRSKVRGIVNDVYTREMPRKEDWSFFLVQSTVTTIAEYNVGNATINTGGTTITFSSDFVIDSAMIGRIIKLSGNDYVYSITGLSSSTGLTISPPLSGNVNASAIPYSIVQPFYSLASNFDRFPKNGGLLNYRGGKEEVIPELPYQEWAQYYTPSPAQDARYCRIIGTDTAGNAILEVTPAPKIAKSYRYDYFIRPGTMRETTAGFVNVSASATTVTGSAGTTLFTQATTGDYFRVDAFGIRGDSEWYRIIAIANDSSLTLQTAFGLSGVTSAGYTICSVPQMPAKMHPAVLYGTILQLAVDQNDPTVQGYRTQLAEVLSDGKRLYKTRVYNQDLHHLGEEYLYRR